MYIDRLHVQNLKDELNSSNKVLILYGARQVGKTTLVREALRDFPGKVRVINAGNMLFVDALSIWGSFGKIFYSLNA